MGIGSFVLVFGWTNIYISDFLERMEWVRSEEDTEELCLGRRSAEEASF